VESIAAGIKIKAHPDFRICVTMNDDASTFEVPEYIHSRLMPQIVVDFPSTDEERRILAHNLPFAPDFILDYVVNFLQLAHQAHERFTVRDGINIARYAFKLSSSSTTKTRRHLTKVSGQEIFRSCLIQAITQILGEDALEHVSH